jgi:hypothetical protein
MSKKLWTNFSGHKTSNFVQSFDSLDSEILMKLDLYFTQSRLNYVLIDYEAPIGHLKELFLSQNGFQISDSKYPVLSAIIHI